MVEVTIKNITQSVSRTYKGSYTLCYVMNDVGSGRWIQDPPQNNEGLSMFVAALTALTEVASIDGDEMYKVAARVAIEEMNKARNAKVVKPKPKPKVKEKAEDTVYKEAVQAPAVQNQSDTVVVSTESVTE